MRHSIFWAAAALALLAAPIAAAQPAPPRRGLDAILAAGTLRVGTTGDYKPFTFKNADGSYEGFDIDRAKALGAALGVKVAFVQTKWSDLLKDFKAAKFDVAMGGISVTLPRQEAGYFSAPYMREGKSAIARCADAAKYGSLAAIDAPGVRVIVNPGGTNEAFDKTRLHKATVVMNKDNLSIFDRLAKGDADVMITDASETRYQQKLHKGVLCAIHPGHPFDFAEKAYLLPRDVPLKLFVDQWQHISENDGAFAAITAKWFQ